MKMLRFSSNICKLASISSDIIPTDEVMITLVWKEHQSGTKIKDKIKDKI